MMVKERMKLGELVLEKGSTKFTFGSMLSWLY